MAQEKDILSLLELDEIVQDGLQTMEFRIRSMGIDLTGDLRRSLRGQVIMEAQRAYGEVNIFFNAYGRYKDMKGLRMPPFGHPAPGGEYIAGIEKFVEAIGIGKFAYVPGYENAKKAPSVDVATRRLVWGIAQGRWGKGTVYRRGQGWYNETKSKIIIKIKKNFQAKISLLTFQTIQESLGEGLN